MFSLAMDSGIVTFEGKACHAICWVCPLQDAAKEHRVHVKKAEHHHPDHPNPHRKRKHDGVC